MTLAVGVDVGGTKVAAGLVDVDSGELVQVLREPTRAHQGGRSVLDLCTRLVGELGREGLPVGVGICELVDRSGQVRSGATVDWRTLDVRAALGPVTLGSDVRVAAVAEARFGAGRHRDPFLYVNIGTGIAHTLVQGGVPYAGAQGFAILVGAPPIEHRSGGLALSEAAGVDTRSVLADPAYQEIVDAASAPLGQALAFLVNALDPEAVVVGGALGLNPGYLARIRTAMRATLAEELSDMSLVPAELGGSAGIVGAALAAATRS